MTVVAKDRELVGQRLTDLLVRAYGALDFWTIACVGEFMPDFPAFVKKQVDQMKDCLNDVQSHLEAEGDREFRDSLVQSISAGCDRLRQVFLELAGYRTLPPANVQRSVSALQQLCAEELPRVIVELSSEVGTPVKDRSNWNPEKQRYYQGILDNLPNLFGINER